MRRIFHSIRRIIGGLLVLLIGFALPAACGWAEGGVCTSWLASADGQTVPVLRYDAESITAMADALNQCRALLPEAGQVYYIEVPTAQLAHMIRDASSEYIDWGSYLPQTLSAQISDGVHALDAMAILSPPLRRDEAIYFSTDHHWTPLGAWYVVAATMRARGVPVVAYDDFSYQTYSDFQGTLAETAASGETIDLILPIAPVRGARLRKDGTWASATILDYAIHGYAAYEPSFEEALYRIDTGFATGRAALVWGDSFSCVALPYLTPYYDRVFFQRIPNEADGQTPASLVNVLRDNGVQDVYIIVSTVSGVQSSATLAALNETFSSPAEVNP